MLFSICFWLKPKETKYVDLLFWVVLVISPVGFLEDLLDCSAICFISHIVSTLKCMCNQNKVIISYIRQMPLSIISHLYCNVTGNELAIERQRS